MNVKADNSYMPKKKKKHVPLQKKIYINFSYDEVLEEWLVFYGFPGTTPLGFAEGLTLNDLYDDAVRSIVALAKERNEHYLIHMNADENLENLFRKTELQSFLALQR